jgi:hypothetical protein
VCEFILERERSLHIPLLEIEWMIHKSTTVVPLMTATVKLINCKREDTIGEGRGCPCKVQREDLNLGECCEMTSHMQILR